MANGLSFTDKDGPARCEIRIKWWQNPAQHTIKDLSISPLNELLEAYIDTTSSRIINYYRSCKIPVFFGHYWFTGNPEIQQENTCCLDYSVAKAGQLVAYRHNS